MHLSLDYYFEVTNYVNEVDILIDLTQEMYSNQRGL